jgi:hypothetical protein
MANIRQDQAQLIITIDAKESAEYQKALQRSAELTRNIKKMSVGTDEYNAALREQAEISKRLSKVDFTKLSIKDLTDRKKALQEQIRILPQVTAAELGLEKELKDVNTALAVNAQRTRAVGGAMRDISPAASSFGASFKKGLAFFAPLGIVEGIRQIGGALFGLAKDSVKAFDEAAKAEAQLEAAIKSTGGAAGKSVEELVAQSAELQKITLFSDDQIQESQGLLLTFTKVGGAIYDQAIPAIADMATAMKSDLSTASIQVGKALNDPVKGVAALSKAGVQFTQDQKDMIKQLVASGDTVGAQTIILKELETQFQGSAKAAADAGLGPLQKFQNRIDDIKEGVGLLITNGLSFLGPILDKVATFAEKFVGVLVSGKKATGEFSGSVNFLVGFLKIMGSIIGFVVERTQRMFANLVRGVEILKGLPAIGLVVKAFAATFDFIVDAVTNTSAVFAGLKAAIETTFDNASNYIKKVLTDIKIFAKEAELLLSFKDATKDRINNEIKALEAERAQYAKAGKTVGKAYVDAYNDVITKEAKAAEIVKKTTTTTTTGGDGGGGTGGGAKSKETKEKQYSEVPKSFTISTTAQAALEERLKAIEEAAKREQLVLEESYREGKISLEQYEIEKLRIISANLATRIELMDANGQKETDKRRELNVALLQVESEIVKERAAQIGELENAQLSELESKFANRLITEEEYNLSRLRVQLNFYDEQLRLLEEAGLVETEVYKKIQEEKFKTQVDYNKQRTDNEARTKELQNSIASEGFGFLQETFKLGAELLSQDERRRKKYGEAIKKLSIAEVFINSLAEISKNYKNYGAIFGTIAAIATTVRAGISISKINATQFYRGGKIKSVSGQLITEQPNINTLPGGDNVLIAAKKDEVVLNQQQQADAGGPEFFRRLGVPGFAGGGLVPSLPRTTPTINAQVLSRNGAPQADSRLDSIMLAVERITEAVSMVPEAIGSMNLKTHVVYTDLAKTQDTVAEIKRLSSY